MPDHDHSYKLLFSHPQMVRDLLEGFVRADWLAQLDYGSLERVNSSYVSDDLRDRADDVVWRVRWGKDWVYIYLLIEFQSTVEHFMAVRIQTYLGLLYQDLISARQLSSDRQLPMVLYNGAPRWNAPEDIASLIQTGPQALERYRPQGHYLLIDERRYRDSDLAPLRNLVAALFRLENSSSYADIGDVLSSLVEWLKSPEQASLRRAFAVWINRVILAKLPGGPVPAVEDFQAMSTLYEAKLERWAEEFKQQGLQQGLKAGREKGHEEGVQQGEALLLQRQLRKRFGELPSWVEPRLQQAQSEQLERWGERLLEIDSLDALFNGE